MVLPGFNDTHLHMLYYAMFQKNVALFGVDSIETIVERCRSGLRRTIPTTCWAWAGTRRP